MSDAERNALNVTERVRELVNNGGMKSRDAIAKVAEENNMSEDSVANA
jgi:hypothetical protein